MSKRHLENILRKELRDLNEVIDAKIVMGLSYAREARQHKFLYARLVNTEKAEKRGWFGKFQRTNFATAFIL